MNCKKVRSKLPVYLMGGRRGSDASAIGEHCASCPACTAELARLRSAWNSLAQLPTPPEAPSDYPAVLARIEALEQKRAFRFVQALREHLAPSFAGTAAAVMILGLISGVLLSSTLYHDSGRSWSDTVYADALSDGPPESLSDTYLQAPYQLGQENAL